MKPGLKYCLIFLLIACMFPSEWTGAQPFSSADLEAKLKEYTINSPWEEVFVQLDRQNYIAGEDLWLSVLTFDRASGLISNRSIVAYVELLNPWNIPVIQMRLQLEKGMGGGNILLPDTLSPGNYTLRAYTGWMKNFLPINCFMHNINIYNPFKNNGFKRKVFIGNISDEALNMDFYPEGGRLVGEVPNRVVVKLSDRSGMGINAEITVKDEQGTELSRFFTGDYGFGSFTLTPEKGKSYYAFAGKNSFRLPDASEDGVAVSVDASSPEQVMINIYSTGKYSLSSESLHILIHSHGTVYYKADINSGRKLTTLKVPGEKLASGVNQITIFGREALPIAERLFFNAPKRKSEFSITIEEEYGRRETVSASLNYRDSREKISRASVSVTPAWNSTDVSGSDEYLLFGSEFGILPWYDSGESTGILNNELIDNFLVSSHSRWIRWDEILSGKLPVRPYRFETEGIYINGFLKNRETGKADTSGLLFMSIPGRTAQFRYAFTDNQGRFSFMLPAELKLKRLIIQPADTEKNVVLEIESPFPWKVPASICYTDTLSDAMLENISGINFNYQVSRIYVVKNKKEAPAEDGSLFRERRFYGIPELEVRMDDYILLPVMQEVFFELVPGVRFRERRGKYEMRVLNPQSYLFYNEPPLAMIDGVVVHDLSPIAGLDPETVEKIEVVRSKYAIGDLYFSGIVNVITRKGNFSNINLPDYAVDMRFKAFESGSIFTYPDYTDTNNKQSRIPDLRNTLYWNPLIRADEKGEIEIEFPTHDQAGDFLMKINGVYESGVPFSLTVRFRTR